MKKKNKLNLLEFKKFLKTKTNNIFLEFKKFLKIKTNNILFSSNSKKIVKDNSKSFYYTCLSSLVIITFFFFSPMLTNFYNTLLQNNKEVRNESKINLYKVLNGKSIEKQEENDVDSYQVFEDIFEFESIPSDTVRLSAPTILQLFKDTNYTLEDVRRNKFVKPIKLSLLPNEMKMIENTKKRKNLFIQIILPLILEENKKIKFDRKKLFSILNKKNNTKAEIKWLNMKFKQYGIKSKDLLTLKVRMDEIPVSLAIAQAAKETGWGTSRFALEGNALFGQWTYSGEGIKPASIDNDKTHKVMRFQILQASIRAYHRNLNTHSSYRKFRKLRAEARGNDEKLNSLILADSLDSYAATGIEYTKILKQIIKQNSLKDFDDVKLLPSSKKLKNLI
jgi:Bax protein